MFLTSDNQFRTRGRLSRKPILNISQSGNAVTTVTVAVKTPFIENGENKVVYIDYVAIGKTAERLAQYVARGSLVTLEGYLDSYKDQEGNYRQVNRIVAFRNEENKEITLKRQQEQG